MKTVNGERIRHLEIGFQTVLHDVLFEFGKLLLFSEYGYRKWRDPLFMHGRVDFDPCKPVPQI